MNIRKSYFILLLLSICATSVHPQQVDNHQRSLMGNVALYGMYGVGIVCGIGLIYKTVQWFTYESNQEVLRKARMAYDITYAQYDGLAVRLEQSLGLDYERGYAIGHRAETIQETVLYGLATDIWCRCNDMTSFRDDLDATITQLRGARDALEKRLNDLSINSEHDLIKKHIAHDMQKTMQNMDMMLPRINLLYKSLYHHRTYFNLYETEARLGNKYRAELDMMALYAHDHERVVQEIKKSALIRFGHGLYPHVKYGAELELDVNSLHHALKNLAYNYPDRIMWAQKLYGTLFKAKEIIITDPLYAYELREKEKARIEKERLDALKERNKIEKEKAEIARAHANAQFQQARVEERKAQALEEKNKILRENQNKKVSAKSGDQYKPSYV